MKNISYTMLEQQALRLRSAQGKSLFDSDPDRFQHFSLVLPQLLVDFSKHLIDKSALNTLYQFAEHCEMTERFKALFRGDIINPTENSPAAHPFYRHEQLRKSCHLNEIIDNDIRSFTSWVNRFQAGEIKGATGEAITDLIHIGIGGSHLGPQLLSEAFHDIKNSQITVHFISSLDPAPLKQLLKKLNPNTTFFSFASKSFRSEESLFNLNEIKSWLSTIAYQQQTLAITSNTDQAHSQGITQQLHISPALGGRFSLWSAISFPIAITIGMNAFNEFLSGGAFLDDHVQSQPISQNLPIILALLDFWYHSFFQVQTKAILPYAYALKLLPGYLQQLHMESLGKSITLTNENCEFKTGAIHFGEMGTNGQHSFHQLLLQGQHLIPIDFIIVANHNNPSPQHHALLKHCLAQSRSLFWGHSESEILQEKLQQGLSLNEAKQIAKREALPGNQPSTTIILNDLSPYTIGQLIALYEHKVFAYAQLCNINAFDQPGVEYGKLLANQKWDQLKDSSSQGLKAYYKFATKG